MRSSSASSALAAADPSGGGGGSISLGFRSAGERKTGAACTRPQTANTEKPDRGSARSINVISGSRNFHIAGRRRKPFRTICVFAINIPPDIVLSRRSGNVSAGLGMGLCDVVARRLHLLFGARQNRGQRHLCRAGGGRRALLDRAARHPARRRLGESIIDAINEARAMVLVFSSNANEAQSQIKREVERAVNKGIPVDPLPHRKCDADQVAGIFPSTPHWLDAFTPPLDEHVRQLADSIKRLLGKQAAERPPHRVAPPRDAVPGAPARNHCDRSDLIRGGIRAGSRSRSMPHGRRRWR